MTQPLPDVPSLIPGNDNKLIQSLVASPDDGSRGADVGNHPGALPPVWQPGQLLPPAVLDGVLTSPVYIQRLKLSPVHATVTVHASLKVFISVDDTVVSLAGVSAGSVFASPPQHLLEVLGSRYASEAMYKAGWAVGSLGILGNPAGLARAFAAGFHDLLAKPMEGLALKSPAAFLSGINQGTSSFVKHISVGTLESITSFASSMSQNLDRLAVDEALLERRRASALNRSASSCEQITNSVSSMGFSMLSAVAGVVEEPMRTLHGAEQVTAGRVLAGFGKGLLGAFTKPVGGAMDLLASTSKGLLHGSGLASGPQMRSAEARDLVLQNSALKYRLKVAPDPRTQVTVLRCTELLGSEALGHPRSLLLSQTSLVLYDVQEDLPLRTLRLEDVGSISMDPDPAGGSPVMLVMLVRARQLDLKRSMSSPSLSSLVTGPQSYRFGVKNQQYDAFIATFARHRAPLAEEHHPDPARTAPTMP